ncbi:MAG: hypothetical protein WDM90_08920 [Ferruginibacter sp.]
MVPMRRELPSFRVTTGNYRVVPFPYESPTHHAFCSGNQSMA